MKAIGPKELAMASRGITPPDLGGGMFGSRGLAWKKVAHLFPIRVVNHPPLEEEDWLAQCEGKVSHHANGSLELHPMCKAVSHLV